VKSSPGEPIAEIESRALQIGCAFVVDEKLNPVSFDNGVARFPFVERHFVVQTRAAALGNLDAQTLAGVLLLLVQKGAQLSGRVLGNVNHGNANYDLTRVSQKRLRS